MAKMDSSDSDYEEMDSDEEIQDLFAKGKIKPGLNISYVNDEKKNVNNVTKILSKLSNITLKLSWMERLDLINDLAPLAPELAMHLERYEQKRENQFKGNAKIPHFKLSDDPVLNDFKREMLFHRQAQAAVVEGMRRFNNLGVNTKRPDDYFAEMAKSDEHMQKVRQNLAAKREGQAKSERIRKIREQRKMNKILQKQAKVQKVMDKKEMMDQLKKFRKGKLKNLDFLNDDEAGKNKLSSAQKRKNRDKKFGFGGKKRGLKKNTKASSMGLEKVKNFIKKGRGSKSKKMNSNRKLKK